jgi:DNA-binding NarL/FixJ family response regulator
MESRRLRVLIVDDTPIVRAVVRRTLAMHDYFEVVGEAQNGRIAIEQTLACEPELVLLDLAMPEMDGLEALPHILVAAPTAKVIVLSAFSPDQMAAQAIEAGACAYLEKNHLARELVPGIFAALGDALLDAQT